MITPTVASPGRELHHVVADLNPVLRGWGAYFRYGNSNRKFAAIDSYVHLRMSKLASVKYATRGPTSSQPVQLWLADRTRRLSTHRKCPEMGACACLTMNGVGKPCAGEPHARFDRGPLGRLTPRRDGITCTQRETDGTEPIRRTGYTEPAAYLTTSAETSHLIKEGVNKGRDEVAGDGARCCALIPRTWVQRSASDAVSSSAVLQQAERDAHHAETRQRD